MGVAEFDHDRFPQCTVRAELRRLELVYTPGSLVRDCHEDSTPHRVAQRFEHSIRFGAPFGEWGGTGVMARLPPWGTRSTGGVRPACPPREETVPYLDGTVRLEPEVPVRSVDPRGGARMHIASLRPRRGK